MRYSGFYGAFTDNALMGHEHVEVMRMRENGVWATQVEVVAAANVLGVLIALCTGYGNLKCWQLFKPFTKAEREVFNSFENSHKSFL